MNIIRAIEDEKLFKPCFRDLKTWRAWLIWLKALFGLKMNKSDLKLYQASTGRDKPPKTEFKEVWTIIGRRGGKSFIASIVAVYLALFYEYKQYLSPGERGVIQVIASDRAQARVIFKYILGILRGNPIFEQYIVNETREIIELSTNVDIEVMSCSFRAVRGRTLVCAIFDEIAFWRVEGASPDKEILAAVRPGMATIPNSKLIVISSPYARYGVLYEAHRDYFGKPDTETLIWHADTRTMNPTIPQRLIDREMEKDPSAARSEWYAQFREDIEEFLNLTAVEACCVLQGTLAPDPRNSYLAFTDPSGGRSDAFTLAIGRRSNGKITTDLLKAWEPPFNPNIVVQEIAQVLRDYRIDKLVGDRYGAAWVSSAFEKERIRYEPCDKVKSDLYLSLEGYINTGTIELPDNKRLITELVALERRRGKSGRDVIDHPPRGRDDRANAVAGLCYEGMKKSDLLFKNLRVGVNDEEL